MNPHTINVFVYGVMTNSLDRDHIGHEAYFPLASKWLPVTAIEHRPGTVKITAEHDGHEVSDSYRYDSPLNLRVPAGPEPKAG